MNSIQMPQSKEDKEVIREYLDGGFKIEEWNPDEAMFHNAIPRTRAWAIEQVTEAEDMLADGAEAHGEPREEEPKWKQFWLKRKRDAEATLEALYKANLPEDERPIGNNLTALNVYRSIKNQGDRGADADFLQTDAALSSGAVSSALKFLEMRCLVGTRFH